MNESLQQNVVSRRSFLLKTATLVSAAVAANTVPTAQAAPLEMVSRPKQTLMPIASGVTYQQIGRWEVSRLNHILQVEAPAFTGFKVDYKPARNAVDLFRVVYPTVIPEQNNKPTIASGLIAIPADVGASARLVSYQHGTVYGKQEVPSFPEQSPETKLMIAAFAGRGDILLGADYIGMGLSGEPESYLVLGSQQQATADMIRAGQAVLADRSIQSRDLYLAGWSEGGFVTMGLLERLEDDGMAVKAAATASAPVDLFLAMSGYLFFPRPNDASWLNSIFVLSAFAYEYYYNAPGLAESLFYPKYIDACRNFYLRKPVDITKVPTDLHRLIRAEYFNPNYFMRSEYGRLVHRNEVFRWIVETPTRNYYGESDEAITVGLGKLAMNYQKAMGNINVEAISAGHDATHRGTFARAVLGWSNWFEETS